MNRSSREKPAASTRLSSFRRPAPALKPMRAVACRASPAGPRDRISAPVRSPAGGSSLELPPILQPLGFGTGSLSRSPCAHAPGVRRNHRHQPEQRVGGQPRSRSASTSAWIASIPHFSLSGRTFVSTPACRIHSSARDGSGAESSLFSSAQTRSADSLSRSVLQPRAGLQPFGIGPPGAVPGEKAEKPQDAQDILADSRLCVADEAQRPAFEIGQSADEIDHPSVGLGVERIDREVAPLRVGLPVASERTFARRPSVSTSARSVVTS